MNISKEDYQRYLDKDLSLEKIKEIDAYLASHPLENKALQAMADFDSKGSFDAMTTRLEAAIDQTIIAKTPPKRRKQPWTKWIGTIVLIVALYTLYTQLVRYTTTDDIAYASYFEAYPDVVSSTLRGQLDTPIDDLKKAMVFYINQDYSNAANALRELVESDGTDQRISFYYSVSLMGAEKYEEAYPILHRLSENPSFPYMDGVLWNKALACLSLGKESEAKELLTEIVSNNVYKKEEALELLNKQQEK